MRICPFCKIVAEARLAAAVTEPRTEKSFILKVSSSSGELKQGGNRENCLLAMGYCPLYISQLIPILRFTGPFHLGRPNKIFRYEFASAGYM
jgi:hypothetical protein